MGVAMATTIMAMVAATIVIISLITTMAMLDRGFITMIEIGTMIIGETKEIIVTKIERNKTIGLILTIKTIAVSVAEAKAEVEGKLPSN